MAEGFRQYASLQRALAYQMEQAEFYVRPLRIAYLTELQERLNSLNKLT